VTVGWTANQGASVSSDEEADLLWGGGDLDWFLTRTGDSVPELGAG
jgi:hypothetical protein